MPTKEEEADLAMVIRDRETSNEHVGIRNLKSFFGSPKFSDFTIKVDEREFKVHKIVIYGQSEYFNRLFNSDWKEALDNKIELKEDDPGAVEAMLRFMYENEYDSGEHSWGRISPMLFHVRVHAVADKYGVAALKKLSKQKFDHATSVCWDMDDFPHVVADVYDNTLGCEELRDTVARASHEHIEALLIKDTFIRVLRDTSGFAADIIGLMRDGITPQARYECPKCGVEWEAKLVPGKTYCCLHCGSRQSNWSSYIISGKD
ncbi:hypothetical protein AYL99_04881 [Fonsecaea erecta]|uniref:BTB domain-containing protein n=1 Tax=Fonsecaea erecta TaxID=1367422 RepID=A0A178ZJ97_9EURO|nr:hypothetical protein AYL99_04881 [Fonsecaea erecta]OAP59879.1 hypothetical protein AYL99_04881 [Fonsecaea erecta]